ncbi:DUF6153 family protein [Streptomyces boninensis]|uniref:DUF6153 family protein n=1 Tax=Streptomyces boninensis TaxID=2039455 RepID=UPI003B22671B
MGNGWSRMGGVIGRLLFVAVLALGVTVMHTSGHPDGASAQGMSSSMHTSHHMAPATPEAGHHDQGGGSKAIGLATGMDMASVCLAILGTWAFVALLRAAFARSGHRPVNWPAHAAAAPRPNSPPPRPPDLSLLSVLRT